MTSDLCKPCNSRFGSEVDLNLIRDGKVMQAAKSVGVSIDDFLKPLGQVGGKQTYQDGSVRTASVKGGVFRTEPQLSDPNKLSISAFDEQFRAKEIKHLEKRLIAKHGVQHTTRVEALVNQIVSDPTKTVCDAELNEGLRPILAASGMAAEIDSDPWKTHWCIAKIIVESAQVTFSQDYLTYLNPVFEQLKAYVENGIKAERSGRGKGILKYIDRPESLGAMHRVVISSRPDRFIAEVTLYGSACWCYDIELTPMHAPSFSEEIVLDNPLDKGINCPSPQIKRS